MHVQDRTSAQDMNGMDKECPSYQPQHCVFEQEMHGANTHALSLR